MTKLEIILIATNLVVSLLIIRRYRKTAELENNISRAATHADQAYEASRRMFHQAKAEVEQATEIRNKRYHAVRERLAKLEGIKSTPLTADMAFNDMRSRLYALENKVKVLTSKKMKGRTK